MFRPKQVILPVISECVTGEGHRPASDIFAACIPESHSKDENQDFKVPLLPMLYALICHPDVSLNPTEFLCKIRS